MRPVTAGAAMLVPDFRVTPDPVRERAARTACPGAESSGFSRPSRVGPLLEKLERGMLLLCASNDPTTIECDPVEIDPRVWVGTGAANDDWAPSFRSIQA